MRLLPRGSSTQKPRHKHKKRQGDQTLGSDSDEDSSSDGGRVVGATRTGSTITVINGHTVTGPANNPAPTPDTSTSTSSSSSDDDDDDSTSSDSKSSSTKSSSSNDDSSSSSDNILDSPSTQRITASSSPTRDDEDDSSSVSKTKSAPTGTKSEKPSKTASTPSRPKFDAGGSSDKKHKDEGEKKGGLPVTTWVGIACGCLGALLLIMAISAYYRRWRRRKDEAARAAAGGDNDSFFGKSGALPDSPRSIARSSMSSEKGGFSPDWADAPLVPPMPMAYRSTSALERSNSLPEPVSASGPEDVAPFRRDSAEVSPVRPLAIPRQRAPTGPTAIVTSGDSRLFSRPVSEVVLQGHDQPSSPQYYENTQAYRAANARHNSYASSKYESIHLPSRRDTMSDDQYPFHR